jgi:triacylglycerol lipase
MDIPTLTHPIILVHGILGFSELRVGGVKVGDYFRGVADLLRASGNTVPTPPQLNTAGSVEQRAGDLRDYLKSNADIAGQQVHLIAHSMGGLDSRFMISRLGMAQSVLSLTTIGTPHNGTPFADQGLGALGQIVQPLLAVGIDVRGFLDLTSARGQQFNQDNPDAATVRYYSVAGVFEPRPPNVLKFFAGDLLKLPHDLIVAAGGGDNDGLVPADSAKHGTFLGTWTADHFRLINWATNLLTPVEELEDDSVFEGYASLVQNLADAGF